MVKMAKAITGVYRKTEYIDWFVNYTEIAGNGRVTKLKRFDTLKEATEFKVGKYGYITRASDGASDFNTDKAKTTFIECFGGFVPSAQEMQNIRNLTGK
jgi:hypothetical protein